MKLEVNIHFYNKMALNCWKECLNSNAWLKKWKDHFSVLKVGYGYRPSSLLKYLRNAILEFMGQLFKHRPRLKTISGPPNLLIDLVWDGSLLVTVNSRQCLDMTVGKIENGLERGFVKHRLNCLSITDPMTLLQLTILLLV